MTPEQRDKLMRYLEAYLDDRLPRPNRAAFEKLLERSPELRRIVARQRDCETALRRHFAPPAAPDILSLVDAPALDAPQPEVPESAAAAGSAGDVPRVAAFRRGRAWAVAAGLALVAGGLYLAREPIGGLFVAKDSEPPPAPAPRTLASIYKNEIAKGFQVQWQCKSDEEFINTFRDRLGQPLALGALPPGVESLGLSYTTGLSLQTVFLLARADQREVIVFVDRLSRDKPQADPPAPGLHIHRREIGNLVLYELSPFDQPRLLGHFRPVE